MIELPPMSFRMLLLTAVAGCALASLGVLLGGCGPKTPAQKPAKIAVAREVEDTSAYNAESIGEPFELEPWISHVSILDLDQDGLADVIACDDRKNAVVWIRQTSRGHFQETVLADHMNGPVHVEAVDLKHTGHLDLLVACMGELFPNNDKIGSIIILENDGQQHFRKHVIAEHVTRVTDVRAADLNGDGRLDLAVAQFGYIQGEIQWFENLGDWKFAPHNLLNLSGAINVCVADMNGDGTPDIVAVVSQEWEEVYLFQNDGHGKFQSKILFGSTNEDFGSSGISLCDLNRDGRPDILYTNGDGFAYADPGKRPWHGLQWLENVGQGQFRFHRIGDLPGAYSPVGVDLDGHGVFDVVCVSGFNDWKDPQAASLVVFKNDGHMNFTEHVLAHQPIQLITCAAGDLDGNGRPCIIAGSYCAYPPFDRMGRITLWRKAVKP